MRRKTVTEYLPDYNGLQKCYITYDLDEMTYSIDGKVKPLIEGSFMYKKALEVFGIK